MTIIRGIKDIIGFILKLIGKLVLILFQAVLGIAKIFLMLLSMILRILLAFMTGCA